MYGQSGHGKTNFLYDNFLNGKWDEEKQNIESSLGYNFESITSLKGQKYGIWDISGHPEELFLKRIPFHGVIYVIRPRYQDGNLVEDKLKELGLARQQLFYISNHKSFVNKFLLILLNIEEQHLKVGKDSIIDVTAEKLESVIDEIKELIKYDQINVQQKHIMIMDKGSSYLKVWEKVGHLLQKKKN